MKKRLTTSIGENVEKFLRVNLLKFINNIEISLQILDNLLLARRRLQVSEIRSCSVRIDEAVGINLPLSLRVEYLKVLHDYYS